MDTYKITTAEVYKSVQYLEMLSMLVVVLRFFLRGLKLISEPILDHLIHLLKGENFNVQYSRISL